MTLSGGTQRHSLHMIDEPGGDTGQPEASSCRGRAKSESASSYLSRLGPVERAEITYTIGSPPSGVLQREYATAIFDTLSMTEILAASVRCAAGTGIVATTTGAISVAAATPRAIVRMIALGVDDYRLECCQGGRLFSPPTTFLLLLLIESPFSTTLEPRPNAHAKSLPRP